MALIGGNKNPLHFFDAGKQSLEYAASTGQKPVSHIASLCVSVLVYQKNIIRRMVAPRPGQC
jgi:hypothetical protein